MKRSSVIKTWSAYGLPCVIREITWGNGTSHYCGYVGVKENHRVLIDAYDWVNCDTPNAIDNLSVHGGVTYVDGLDEMNDDLIYIGFYCAHAGDCRNGEEPKLCYCGYEHIWTVDEVKEETERLAKQISEL